ncbi:hypothetical protein ACOME3_004099 [Neoechinorhynchus agilis]
MDFQPDESSRIADLRSCRCDEIVLMTYATIYFQSKNCQDYERALYYLNNMIAQSANMHQLAVRFCSKSCHDLLKRIIHTNKARSLTVQTRLSMAISAYTSGRLVEAFRIAKSALESLPSKVDNGLDKWLGLEIRLFLLSIIHQETEDDRGKSDGSTRKLVKELNELATDLDL